MARKANRKMWEDIIGRQKDSGVPQIKWCQENDVNIHNFRYWIGRLKNDSKSKSNEWAALVVPPTATVNADVSKRENSSILKITIGKVSIAYHKNACIDDFEKVIQVLMKYV
jgi:hypothetical protein